jgi:hypothetical protein
MVFGQYGYFSISGDDSQVSLSCVRIIHREGGGICDSDPIHAGRNRAQRAMHQHHRQRPQGRETFAPTTVLMSQLRRRAASSTCRRGKKPETGGFRWDPRREQSDDRRIDRRFAMNANAVTIGFAHSALRDHRHVCAFFNSAEQKYDILLPGPCSRSAPCVLGDRGE